MRDRFWRKHSASSGGLGRSRWIWTMGVGKPARGYICVKFGGACKTIALSAFLTFPIAWLVFLIALFAIVREARVFAILVSTADTVAVNVVVVTRPPTRT